ncbi:DUF389 domain-containing protein [Aridibaculum aurantiacum]|uniref:DUF389 domain-containing protein n=1 Tax=Aridibaculum aurantiacum TaxID=2810307 RepID=UPI001A96BEC8|nr:DUF389 domain-containing protein [Aridibaculum aurantiacum]
MRPLFVQVNEGNGKKVMSIADSVDAKNISSWRASGSSKPMDVVVAYVSNKNVEKFIADVSEIEEAQITLFPQGVMAMYPPANDAPQQVTNIENRSPIEIFMAGLQSIGSWKGFISYCIIAGIVVWIGLFTNTSYLLVGAMLIAPFAGPAMNAAIATSRGDMLLLRRSMLRYAIAIVLTVCSCFLLSLLLQQEVATTMMVERSQVSSVAVLLALAAGAAGAINLIQSERDSLVSGAATGMLVAASLAPPAGVVGMAMAIGEWNLVKSGIFLLVLQLLGMNLTGSIIFRLAGLRPKGARFPRGNKMVVAASMAVTLVLFAGVLAWQFSTPLELERSSTSKRAEAEIQKTVNAYKGVGLVEASARFTRANIPGKNTLLCIIYVQQMQPGLSTEQIKQELQARIIHTVKSKFKNVDPVVNIVVL